MKRKPTEVRQAEIVEAAMKIIAVRGGRHFTAQLIADEVGMTAGGIFRHFSSMDGIVEAVLDHMEEVLFERFPPSAEDPWRRLHDFFEHRIQVMIEHPDISRILLSDDLSHLGGEGPAGRLKELKRRSRQFVAQCLQEAADCGEMADGVTVNAAAVMVLGAILAVGHATTRITEKAETDRLTAEVWSVIEKMRHFPGVACRRQEGAKA